MSTDTCSNCGLAGGDLRACGHCVSTRYCSESCQMAHWASHRIECEQRAQIRAIGGEEITPRNAWQVPFATKVKSWAPWLAAGAAVLGAAAYGLVKLQQQALRSRPRYTPHWTNGL